MKKLLFLAMIVLGTSLAQAQDDNIKRFRFKASEASTSSDRNHLFSEDFDHCNSNVIDAGDIDTFTWNSSTGFLSFNGSPQGSAITGRRANGLNNLFAAEYNEVNITSSRGGFVSRLIYNESTNTWE